MTQLNTGLRFYFHPMSRARTVHWMLEECDAQYDAHSLTFDGTMKAPGYLSINPMGKVPSLVHGNTVITEVAAILAYLADLYPDKQLAPSTHSTERGTYYRWLFFVAGPAEAATTAQSQGLLEGQTAEQALSAGYGRFDDVVETLRGAVDGRRYLCGDHFSAADVLMASYLHWSTLTGGLPSLPAFSRYCEPLLKRPAQLRASKIDDTLSAAA